MIHPERAGFQGFDEEGQNAKESPARALAIKAKNARIRNAEPARDSGIVCVIIQSIDSH